MFGEFNMARFGPQDATLVLKRRERPRADGNISDDVSSRATPRTGTKCFESVCYLALRRQGSLVRIQSGAPSSMGLFRGLSQRCMPGIPGNTLALKKLGAHPTPPRTADHAQRPQGTHAASRVAILAHPPQAPLSAGLFREQARYPLL